MRPAMTTESGLSLIEVAAAILILSTAVVTGFRSLDHSSQMVSQSVPRLIAKEIALNRLSELRVVPQDLAVDLPNTRTVAGDTWTIAVDYRATEGGFLHATVRVSAPGQPGATASAYVLEAPG